MINLTSKLGSMDDDKQFVAATHDGIFQPDEVLAMAILLI
jgi:hypothetical protein